MKIKEQVLKQKDNDFQESLSFLEWLNYFSKKQNDKKKVSNNPSYHPLQGA